MVSFSINHHGMKNNTSTSVAVVLEKPALDERLMASVKMNFDLQQQEAILTLESQLNDLARHVQTASQAS